VPEHNSFGFGYKQPTFQHAPGHSTWTKPRISAIEYHACTVTGTASRRQRCIPVDVLRRYLVYRCVRNFSIPFASFPEMGGQHTIHLDRSCVATVTMNMDRGLIQSLDRTNGPKSQVRHHNRLKTHRDFEDSNDAIDNSIEQRALQCVRIS
jgi:hypothetical protein